MTGVSAFTSSAITITSFTISKAIFYGVTMSDATISGLDISGITYSGGPNSGGTLTEAILKNADFSQVKTLFESTGKVTYKNLNIHNMANLETLFVTNLGNAMVNSSTLTTLTISRSMMLIPSGATMGFGTGNTISTITQGSNVNPCIVMIESGTFQMDGTTITGLTGQGNLVLETNVGTVKISDSTITSCTATGNYPTLISSKLGSIEFTNTYIHHNTGKGEGTVYITLSSVKMSGSKFERNVALSRSHNLYITTLQTVAILTECTFIDDPTYSASDSCQSTFISIADGDLQLNGCTFTGAHNTNGAVYLNGEIQTLTVNNTVFQNGYLPQTSRYGVSASAIFGLGVINLNYSTFNDNVYAIYAGNGDFFYSTGSTFQRNQYLSVYLDGIGNATIVSTTFDGYPGHSYWNISAKTANTETNRAGIIAALCTSVMLLDSKFQNLIKYDSTVYTELGAALQLDDSSSLSTMTSTLMVSGSTFTNNIADEGGSIYINVPDPNVVNVKIIDSTFTYNYAWDKGASVWYHGYAAGTSTHYISGTTSFSHGWAGVGGGAIYYQSHRPTSSMTSTTPFTNNTSPYGPNYASYPVSLGIIKNPDYSLWKAAKDALGESRLLEEPQFLTEGEAGFCSTHPLRVLAYETVSTAPAFVSGLYMDPPLVIGLQDAENQTCTIWNTGTGTISFASSKVSPYTTTIFNANNGVIVFYPMKLSFAIGATTTATVKSSISIDSGSSVQTTALSIAFTSYFRKCGRGERETDTDECFSCPKLYYILSKESKGTCAFCPDNLNCFGGDLIGPSVNYWRLDGWKQKALRCVNDEACLGYQVDPTNATSYNCTEQYNSTFCYTGFCSERYQGNLCATCSTGNAKSSQIYCVACANNPGYYVLFVVILIVAVAFIVFTVKNAMKVKKEIKEQPKSAILMKIFTNYTQLISIVASFDFQWPDQITGLFSAQSKVASSSSSVFSIDCFFPEAKPGASFRPFFVKLLFISLSPLLLVGIAALVWHIVLKIYAKKAGLKEYNKREFRSKLTTTSVVLLFMVHTNIIQTTLQGFKCVNFGDDTGSIYFLDQDLDIQCYEGLHNYWAFGCALPAFIFWGLGIPLFAWRLLKKNIPNFDQIEFKSKFGFLYDGYKVKRYYWEFIILYRKIAMVFISIFLVTFGTHIQALFVLLVAFLCYILQSYSEPFMHDELNQMEKKALLSASLTLYAGLYFLTKSLPVFLTWILVIVVFLLNGIFFFSWLKALVLDYKKQFKDGKEKAKKEKEEKQRLIESGQLQPDPPKKSLLQKICKKKKKEGEEDPEVGIPQTKSVAPQGEGDSERINIENKDEKPPTPNNDDLPPPRTNQQSNGQAEKKKKQKAALCFKQRKTSDF